MTLILGLAACSATARISESEAQAREILAVSGMGANELAEYGQRMAAEYLRIADSNVLTQDLVSVSLIGLAAAGVVAAVDGASAQTLTNIGVGGLALGSGARYFDLAGSTSALVTAASQHLCISAVAASAGETLPKGAAIVVQGYDRSRILLRQALVRTVPTYAELVAEFGTARNSSFRESSRNPVDIQSNVDACLPRSG
jgi:hypothetical protein